MASRLMIALLFATAASAVVIKSQSKATPIEKVIELLKGLEEKVTKDGKKDAAQYDKFACFCKEQADEKLYAIEKSTKNMEDLKAIIVLGGGKIDEMNGNIGEMSQQITSEESELDDKTEEDRSNHAKYSTNAAELSQSIAACDAAITALTDAKEGLTDAKLDFIQMKTVASKHASPDTLSLIDQLGEQKQAPAKYEFQSNDIIVTLLHKFKDMKDELDQVEIEREGMFMKVDANLRHLLKVDNKNKDETESDEKALEAEVEEEKKIYNQESQDKDSDEIFMKDLTAECEDKAEKFYQRSDARRAELTQLSKAIGILEEGVKPKTKANKNLNGFMQSPSFLQIKSKQQKDSEAIRKVEALLQSDGERFESKVLSSAAVRLQLAGDHFVKVRGIIKDLITKLKDEAEAEASQKAFCDREIGAATKKRDTNQAATEKNGAELSVANTKLKEQIKSLEELAAGIAKVKKAMLEETDLRDMEREDQAETVADAKAGAKATELAIETLAEFYGFLQTGSKKQEPEDEDEEPKESFQKDRSGKTIGDRKKESGADQASGKEYHGAKDSATGIVGILQVILGDFERTIRVTTQESEDAESEYEASQKESDDEKAAKEKESDTIEQEKSDTEDKIVTLEEKNKDANTLLEEAHESLDSLHASCVEGEETYEERVAKRNKEIASLKDAIKIFQDLGA